jgi:hypothetical protein
VGRDKIENGEFSLEDTKTNRELHLSHDLHTQFYPGQRVAMAMIYKQTMSETQTCPRCGHEYAGNTDKKTIW